MSNALAIASVSAVLRDLLNNGLIDHGISTAVGSPVAVSLLPPDRIKIGDEEEAKLNLFLYQATPNSGWQNTRLPWRDSAGQRLTNHPLALDLHYLLTAYGKNDFDCEILLGYAMQLFHETPVLTRDAIRAALAPAAPVTSAILPIGPLSASELADQVEQIKIAPLNLSTEELSKLWTALQAHYRPTAAYQASVVLIESTKSTKSAKPVTKRNLVVLPFQPPSIEAVEPQIATPGTPIVITGHNLKADLTKVTFGNGLLDPDSISATALQVTLPGTLRPGVNTVQVVQPLDLKTGNTAEPHRGFESNVAPFLLAPQITVPASVAAGDILTITVAPPVGRAQLVSLLLGDVSISIPARSPTGPATTTSLAFPIPSDLPKKSYPVRVQIDGAQSLLEVDTDPTSPTFQQYTGNPSVNVT